MDTSKANYKGDAFLYIFKNINETVETNEEEPEETTPVETIADSQTVSVSEQDISVFQRDMPLLHDGNDSITTMTTTHKACYGNQDDFQEMLTDIWPSILQYITDNQHHEHTKQWKKWMNDGLSDKTNITNVKHIIGVESLEQLYLILRDSPAVTTHYDIQWDHKIKYSPKLTTKDQSHTSTNMIDDDSSKNIKMIRSVSDNDIEFCIFHKLIFEEITSWANSNDAKLDNKWMMWNKWIYAGLKPIQPAKEIRKILDINNINEYIDKLQPFQPFHKNFVLYDTANSDSIKYSYNNERNEDLLQPDKITRFNASVNIQMHQMQQRLQDFNTKIEGCGYTLKNHFSLQRTKLKNLSAEVHTEYTTKFKHHLDNLINESAANYVAKFEQHMDHVINERITAFQQQLDIIFDEMIQDAYGIADDGNATMTATKEQLLTEFQQKMEEHKALAEQTLLHHVSPPNKPTPSRFSNVKIDPNFRRPPNPYDNASVDPTFRCKSNTNPFDPNASFSDLNFHQPSPTPTASYTTIPSRTATNIASNRTIPNNVNLNSNLPPVNHDQAIKRAKIQFNGLNDVFVFYNQLMNAMEQFGIYLIPLHSVKYQMSLCPTHYNGIPIDAHRKQIKGNTLYQKLQNPDVLPTEYISVRNIINRYAEINDGYEVPYAVLELVHPALQTDQVISPPTSHECNDDIHLYAMKFDAWLHYESYANRPYSAREQVNKFISELSPHFAPAVSRVRRLLDAWNPFDMTVPEVLRITTLPNTIARFMDEETGTNHSFIRKLNDNKKYSSPQHQRNHIQRTDNLKRQTVDKFCNFCGMHGHITTQCEFYGKTAYCK